MVMLGSVALAVARNLHEWIAAFAIAFGVWDIFFYVFLKLMIHWPESLSTWDILFLIPLPWVGPVWAPVLVACHDDRLRTNFLARGRHSRRVCRIGPGVSGGRAGHHHRVRVGFP